MTTQQMISGLWQDAEYFYYEATQKGEMVYYSPAYGYPLNWGESYEDNHSCSVDKFLTNFTEAKNW